MASLDGLPPLREVVARHGLAPRKALGQNFLFDLNLTARIARAGGDLDGATVMEVGPGPGGLTRALLAQGAARVVAIERDERALPALAEIAEHYPGCLEVRAADALRVEVADVLGGADDGRIVAGPGGDAYGRLGVLAGWRTEARIAFDVPPGAFVPPPKVTSSVVVLTPRSEPIDVPPRALAHVTQLAFGQRRKMLRQSLKPIGGATLLEVLGIDPTRRPETLDVADFCALARAYADGPAAAGSSSSRP